MVPKIVEKFHTFNDSHYALKRQQQPLIINHIMIQINLTQTPTLLSFHPLLLGSF
jgi:hypothetical protein